MSSNKPTEVWKVKAGAVPGFYLVSKRGHHPSRRYCAFTSAGQWKVCGPSGAEVSPGDDAGEIIQAVQAFGATL